MNNNKDFKWIYDKTDYGMIIKASTIILILFLLTMYALKVNTDAIVKEQRVYDKFSPSEIEWKRRTQHALNRPMDKKINL